MTLAASGEMSLGGSTAGRSVNLELECAATASINMNRADVRTLAGRPTTSSAICMQNFYGKTFFPIPTAFGQCRTQWGGFYMGRIAAAGTCYYLFVAPNATGCARCIWKTTVTGTAGTCSTVDGFANTYPALNNADHPAGNWCATRTIAGFSDWYLPAINELALFYTNGATGNNEAVIGAGQAFAAQAYWSSTERPDFTSQACEVSFFCGSPTIRSKVGCVEVRAIRRIQI